MGAPRVGRWYRVRWGDWLAYLAARRSAPAEAAPTPRSDATAWAARKIADEGTRGAA